MQQLQLEKNDSPLIGNIKLYLKWPPLTDYFYKVTHPPIASVYLRILCTPPPENKAAKYKLLCFKIGFYTINCVLIKIILIKQVNAGELLFQKVKGIFPEGKLWTNASYFLK